MFNFKIVVMKNLYSKSVKVMTLITCMLFTIAMVKAQEAITITWKGTVSEDATDVQNWDPPTGMAGNAIVVSHVGNYDDPENPIHPVVTGEEDLVVKSLTIAGPFHEIIEERDDEGNLISTTEVGPYDGGAMVVSMDDDIEFNVENPDNSPTGLGGTLVVTSGTFNHRRNFMLDGSVEDAVLIFEGTAQGLFRDHLGMGDKDGNKGGKVYIRDNAMVNVTGHNKVIRFAEGKSLLTITDNGQLVINGDSREHADLKNSVANGHLTGGDDFFIHYYFDNEINKTYYVAKPETTVQAYFTDRLAERPEFLMSEEDGPEVAVENSKAVAVATNFVWKYGSNPEGPYETVMSSSDETSVLIPNFPEIGNFYLVCEVTTSGETIVSNPLNFIVSSPNLVLTPSGTQFIRGEQVGAPITVTAKEGTISGGEWKWSQTPGLGYQSFDPQITAFEYTPDFEEAGDYYIRFEADMEGTLDISSEIRIVKQAWDAGSLNLTWTGAIDEDYHKATNWNPMALPHRNNIIIPVDSPNWPVFSQGVDTIMGGSSIPFKAAKMDEDGETVLEPAIHAKLIIRGGEEDTLKWRGNVDNFQGELVVESGVFVKDADLLRLHTNSATITVTGTGTAIFNQWGSNPHPSLMMGNATEPTVGGQVHVSGEGKVIFHPAQVFRISTNPEAEFSFFTLSDKGQFIFEGDHTSGAATYIANNRIRLPENYVHVNLYDQLTDYTYVMARNLDDFAIDLSTTQFVAVGTPSSDLNLINTEGLNDFSWLVSQGPFGPWEAFDPAIEGTSANVQFDNIGSYYVAAKAGDGTFTANSLLFRVIEFAVEVDEDGGVYTLSVELPEDMTALGWQIKTMEEDQYEEFEMAGEELSYEVDAFDFFDGDGVYNISFLGVMEDDTGTDVELLATPVTVTIAGGEVVSVEEGIIETGLENATLVVGVYPNPSNGTFYVNAAADSFIVEVIDMSGAVVVSQKVTGSGQPITINAKGVFIVKVVSSEGVGLSRIIVK